MSGKVNEFEKYVKQVVRKLMADRTVSEGIEASSTRGLQASPSIRHFFACINPITKQRSKHRSDFANVKQIPSILPEYILPLVGVVNHNNILDDFEYSLFTTYIPKGIIIVGSQLG
jgi:hypothetical protein